MYFIYIYAIFQHLLFISGVIFVYKMESSTQIELTKKISILFI